MRTKKFYGFVGFGCSLSETRKPEAPLAPPSSAGFFIGASLIVYGRAMFA